MELGEHVHWYTTEECNLECIHCFRPRDSSKTPRNLEKLAGTLADSGVKKVTLTGGEPLLEDIIPALRILKQAGVYTSVHTNGILLDERRCDSLAPYVGDVAIPLDTLNPKVQDRLKSRAGYHEVFPRAMNNLRQAKIPIGIHTVATALNVDSIPEIWKTIKGKVGYWRVYEFNQDLVADRFSSVKRFQEVQELEGKASVSKGQTDCLLARFLLAEKQLPRNPRIQFVALRDPKPPYLFLNQAGELSYYPWYPCDRRRELGDIHQEKWSSIIQKAKEAEEQGPFFDEPAFVGANQTLPLWARVWEGNYDVRELDAIKPRYFQRFNRLKRMYIARQRKRTA